MKNRDINTFTWYDTETSGINHDHIQIYQFASVKTDLNLNIIPDSEKDLLCKPRIDVMPEPGAFLTHMIDIDKLVSEGMTEFELANVVSNEFLSNRNNMVAGYNTIGFDDEVVRRLMFRNMRDPYVHEWMEGNGRFDAFKMIQMVYALRPEMLKWRENDKGGHSLKLEHLVEDNNLLDIEHKAHDALNDVYATISIVKHIKEQNPKLFNYVLQLTNKHNVNSVLFNNANINQRTPVIDVNTIYGAGKRYSSVVLPIITDLKNSSKVLSVDLTKDPTDLLSMRPEDINKYLFTKREELEAHAPRIPAAGITVNKMPMVLQLNPNTLNQDQADKMDIDLDKVEENRLKVVNHINKDPDFIKRLQQGFSSDMSNDEKRDPFTTIYTGNFFSDQDKNVRGVLTLKESTEENSPYKIAKCDVYEEALKTTDKERQLDLILRAKWTNNFPLILKEGGYSQVEFDRWMNFLNHSLFSGEMGATFEDFENDINKYKTERALTKEELVVLSKVESHVEQMKKALGVLENVHEKVKENISKDRDSNNNIKRFERMMKKNENESELSM